MTNFEKIVSEIKITEEMLAPAIIGASAWCEPLKIWVDKYFTCNLCRYKSEVNAVGRCQKIDKPCTQMAKEWLRKETK
jgi:hypothetical protein